MRKNAESRFHLQCGPRGQRREQAIHQESDKGVQQEKSIVLQQHEERQWNARMMEDSLSGPRSRVMSSSEMDERNRKQKQDHRARKACTTRFLFSPKRLPNYREGGQRAKSNGDQKQARRNESEARR